MIGIRSGLRDDVDLRSAGGATFRSIVRSADAELGNGIERDVQSRVGLLRLLPHAAGVDAVKSEVAVV